MGILQSLSAATMVGLLKTSDLINSLIDPFDNFTRAVEPPYSEFLSLKAERFEEDLFENFAFLGGKIIHYRKTSDPNADDWADQALWHGMYTAMLAFKYRVINTSRVRDQLLLCMDGLDMHQCVGREPVRRLIRGVSPDGTKWTDNCSNDSATGHIGGIYYAWLYGDDAVKLRAASLAQGIADELINNNWSLINADKTPTTYGALIQGLITDPLRLAICLCILKVTAKITSLKKYQDAYAQIEKKYNTADLAKYSQMQLVTIDSYTATHRAAWMLSILAEIEEDKELQKAYAQGAYRVFDYCKKQGNSWITFLVSRVAKIDTEYLQQAVKTLQEFSVEAKAAGDVQKVNSTDAAAWKAKGIKFFKWSGQLASSQPLPVWKVGQQDIRWQRGQYDVDDWVGVTKPDTLYNGGDFLAAYWLGRLLGVIKESD
jgi:hypothetical protein